ncbi:hypothetical protein GCM10012275_46520 [Longimycelium tulufanense]|uniref:Uncharacterized protein n=1 Tax=Longimycelium tulufanense TaxID=907463 RepID=A0A8J3CBQ3_9PSEU|nr:hypothetical protein [Longimycelium tulufanense]GGM70772.1 hypothetical protein GCM10012275_46520 [Longimycelium tulufanense]
MISVARGRCGAIRLLRLLAFVTLLAGLLAMHSLPAAHDGGQPTVLASASHDRHDAGSPEPAPPCEASETGQHCVSPAPPSVPVLGAPPLLGLTEPPRGSAPTPPGTDPGAPHEDPPLARSVRLRI